MMGYKGKYGVGFWFVLLLSIGFGNEAEGLPVAVYGEWSVFKVMDQRGQRVRCFLMGIPRERYDNLRRRGESFFLVLRNEETGKEEIYFSFGHFSKKNVKRAEINISSHKFPMFTYQDRGWAYNTIDDVQVLQQLMGNVIFSVEVNYGDGKNLLDIYSLSGFRESRQKLASICN
jgi:hypothetical protein